MPFLTDDGRPLDELLLAQRPANGYRFDLRAPFVYVDPVSGARYPVPDRPGRTVVTDLASVPTVLWSFVASYGRQSAPAVMHDVHAGPIGDGTPGESAAGPAAVADRRVELERRREVDRVFRTALREQGVPLLRAWFMWAWVSADRERALGGVAGVVFFVQAILGPLVIVAACVLAFWHPAWLALALVPAIAAAPWGGLAPLLLVLAYPGAILVPLVALQLVALLPFRLLEAIVEVVTGGDPVGVLRPTLRPERAGSSDDRASDDRA